MVDRSRDDDGRGDDRGLEGMEAMSSADYETRTRVPVFANM